MELHSIELFVSPKTQDVVSNGRINSKLLESTTPTPAISVVSPTINRPISNAIDSEFVYPKRKSPSVLVHFNAEPFDTSYVGDNSVPPPITTYKPVYSTSTTVLPLTSTSSIGVLSTTTPTPIPQFQNSAVISKYFLPPSISQGKFNIKALERTHMY